MRYLDGCSVAPLDETVGGMVDLVNLLHVAASGGGGLTLCDDVLYFLPFTFFFMKFS